MKKVIGLLLILTMVLALAGCGKESGEGVLTIGVDDTYPPMEFRDDDNELVGFDIDFAKALGEELGMEIEFVPTGWDGIFSSLDSERYDCIISSVSITPERMENYEFSSAYLSNGQVIVVKPGDTSVSSSDDLAGKKVGVQLETTADIAATKQLDTMDFELTRYDDIIQTFQDMKNGRLDCIVVDYAVAIEYTTNSPEDYEITTAQLTNEPIGVCIKKGNTELADEITAAIIALRESGKMKEISEEWLGGDYVSDIDEELR